MSFSNSAGTPRPDTCRDYDNVRELVVSLVEDGNLSDKDIDNITAAVDDLASTRKLTNAQRREILTIIRDGVENNESHKVPLVLKVFAVVSFAIAGLLIALGTLTVISLLEAFPAGFAQASTTEIILNFVQLGLIFTICVLHCILSVRLLRNNRYKAGSVTNVMAMVTVAIAFINIMLNGVGSNLIYIGIILALQSLLGTYLSPNLARERKLSDNIKMIDTKYRAVDGTLGLDLEGQGYIKLDFFNLFWIFIVGCVAGLVVEVIFHMVIVEPGVYQDRAGLLWGPFSPIYGFGCVLMTVALNRFKNAPAWLIFVVCTLIGGAFEYLVSFWMEVAFGAVAWDYSNRFLNINGRTCLLYASMFGVLGLVWITRGLPMVLELINRIPWKARYVVTTVCAALMLVDCVMTVQALDCWYERSAGKPVVTEVQQYYEKHFPDDAMQNRFQSMTINPDGGHGAA